MGGFGSGRRSYYGTKNKAEESLPLDIRKLQRTNRLMPGREISWVWSFNDKPFASIRVKVEIERVVLAYRHRDHAENEWQNVEQPVYMTHTPCTYGGTRPWWLCPSCGRRVAVLYSSDKLYACRYCYRLVYTSQAENAYERALSETKKIRLRLGGTANMMEQFPSKPKKMHWKTYWRMRAEHDAFDRLALAEVMRWTSMIKERLG